jgi:hypothetical protein
VYKCTISSSPGTSGQAREEEANMYGCTISSSQGTSGQARQKEVHVYRCTNISSQETSGQAKEEELHCNVSRSRISNLIDVRHLTYIEVRF